MYIRAKIFPNSPRESVEKTDEHVYRIFIREPAQQNMANARVKQILARLYDTSPDALHMIKGHHGNNKLFSILGRGMYK